MEYDELLKKIDKLESKIDELVEQNSKLATNYALVAQDVTRILEINQLIRSVEVKTATNEEKICNMEERQNILEKALHSTQNSFEEKLHRITSAGWGIVVLTITQLLYFFAMILHDKIK